MNDRVYWMEYGCMKTQSPAFAWRFPLGFQCVFLLILLFAVPFYPESPRYLMKIEKLDSAREVLKQCRVDPTDIKIEQEMLEIEDAIRLEATGTSHSFTSMLFKKDRLHTRRRVLLGAGVQVMQKLTGIDFIATYAPEMFSLAGYSGDKPALLAGGNLISYTASLALAIYLADRVGRRKLMLAGSSMMGVILMSVTIFSSQKHALIFLAALEVSLLMKLYQSRRMAKLQKQIDLVAELLQCCTFIHLCMAAHG